MSCERPSHCITCGDDGVADAGAARRRDDALALCEDADGAHHTVEIALVDAGAG